MEVKRYQNRIKNQHQLSRRPRRSIVQTSPTFLECFGSLAEPPRNDDGAPKPAQDATWRLPDTSKRLQDAQARTETTLRRPKTRQRRFQDVSKKRSCSIFNAKMKPSWHQNGIKNRCSLGTTIFLKSCSGCSEGPNFQDLGIQVGSKNQSRNDQKMDSKTKYILASIFKGF